MVIQHIELNGKRIKSPIISQGIEHQLNASQTKASQRLEKEEVPLVFAHLIKGVNESNRQPNVKGRTITVNATHDTEVNRVFGTQMVNEIHSYATAQISSMKLPNGKVDSNHPLSELYTAAESAVRSANPGRATAPSDAEILSQMRTFMEAHVPDMSGFSATASTHGYTLPGTGLTALQTVEGVRHAQEHLEGRHQTVQQKLGQEHAALNALITPANEAAILSCLRDSSGIAITSLPQTSEEWSKVDLTRTKFNNKSIDLKDRPALQTAIANLKTTSTQHAELTNLLSKLEKHENLVIHRDHYAALNDREKLNAAIEISQLKEHIAGLGNATSQIGTELNGALGQYSKGTPNSGVIQVGQIQDQRLKSLLEAHGVQSITRGKDSSITITYIDANSKSQTKLLNTFITEQDSRRNDEKRDLLSSLGVNEANLALDLQSFQTHYSAVVAQHAVENQSPSPAPAPVNPSPSTPNPNSPAPSGGDTPKKDDETKEAFWRKDNAWAWASGTGIGVAITAFLALLFGSNSQQQLTPAKAA